MKKFNEYCEYATWIILIVIVIFASAYADYRWRVDIVKTAIEESKQK